MELSGELLVGRYAEPGIVRSRLEEGGATDGGVPGTRNASFAAYSARHARLYAVREDDEGKIDVLAAEGGLQRVAQVPSGGKLPCHCALDAGENFLAVANYGSGEVAVFTLDPGNGLPQPGPWHYRGAGHGPDKERQASPHAHWVGFSPDQRWLLSIDLGADRIRAFPFDPERGVTGPVREAYVAPAGSGPRWLAFLGDGARALLVSELASTLSLLAWRDGAFELVDSCTTSDAAGEGNLGGHIEVDARGTFAYVTNRGDDTIAVISITGDRVRRIDAVKAGGTSPRFLSWLDGDRVLLAAHEEQGPVTSFTRTEDGRLAQRGTALDLDRAAWIMPFGSAA